ncbi:hypothetical protein V5799_027324 [Amblyomma americanum]|uniref:Secreted protein n=1 Tax=Amblyomma americanum TaxID=6943 RepID=A0AAQ4DG19_AMBAM
MSLIPAFCCLLAWFTFTQRVSTELALREGYSIYSLNTDGGELPVGCIYNYTNGQEFKQGVGPSQLKECIGRKCNKIGDVSADRRNDYLAVDAAGNTSMTPLKQGHFERANFSGAHEATAEDSENGERKTYLKTMVKNNLMHQEPAACIRRCERLS